MRETHAFCMRVEVSATGLPCYVMVGGAPRHTVVIVFVCVCVVYCSVLFSAVATNYANESCNATTARHSTTAKLARFLI